MEQLQPLLAVTVLKNWHPIRTLFSIEPDDIVVSLLETSADRKKIIVHLYDPSAEMKSIDLKWHSLQPKRILLSDLFEASQGEVATPIQIAGYGVKILALVLE